jgi:hypothetical protein
MRFVLPVLLLVALPALAQETPMAVDDSGVYQQATIAPEDPFTITGVVVDATAKNAVEARTEAFAKGSEIAVQKFLEAQGATDASLNGVKPETLVRDFRVDKEQFSRTRYTASLTYRFKPRAMAMIANTSLPPEQALPTPPPEAPSADQPWAPEEAAPQDAGNQLAVWPLTVRFNEVSEWLLAQTLITQRPELRGYKVVSMSGNNAILEVTTAGPPAQISQIWQGIGWQAQPNGQGITLDASTFRR